MAESYEGITVPEGSPGQLTAASQRMRTVGDGLHEAATELRNMPTIVGSWQGPASATYGGQCLSQAQAMAKSGDNYVVAAGALANFSHKLRDARRRARLAIEDAREARKEINEAKKELAAAKLRLEDARRRVAAASFDLSLASVDLGTMAAAQDALIAAQRDETKASDDVRVWSKRLENARDHLERAQRHGTDAEGDAREAAVIAQGVFSALRSSMPRLVLPGPPVRHHSKPDKSPLADAGDWLKTAAKDVDDYMTRPTTNRLDGGMGPSGFDKGFYEALKGTAGGVGLLARGSAFNPNIADKEEANDQLRRGVSHAASHPVEFAKQAFNYDDLSHGRVDEFLGSFGPDALLAAGTAGSVPAAARVGRTAKVLDDVPKPRPHGQPLKGPFEPGQEVHAHGRVVARANEHGNLQPWPPKERHTQMGDARDSLLRDFRFSEQVRQPTGGPPPVTTKKGAGLEALRVTLKSLEELGN